MCRASRADYSARPGMKNGSTKEGTIEILLVDDDPADVTATLQALQKANLHNRIHVLREGGQVQDFLLRAGPFAGEPKSAEETLVILALNLRSVHGLDVLRKIKGDQRTASLPVIILTSSQEERGVMQSYKLGANACIVKPVEFQKLAEAVTELRLAWLLVTLGGPH